CFDGKTAWEHIQEQSPDVVFLDINMPLQSGMQVSERIQQSKIETRVVFVTAYQQHAVEAFDRDALDYLLKPVTDDRLARTLERVRASFESQKDAQVPVHDHQAGGMTHLVVKVGERKKILPLDSISCFVADGKYARVLCEKGEYLLSESLKALEQQLPEEAFWRIHRGTLVNPNQISETRRTDTGRLELKLKSRPEVLTVSRRFLWRFKAS
ncbi:MAG: LytR/AlgR family response regulator transcription factor, partial [Oceanobacter sp.]